ncbi:MAG: MBL fold metallo-hydrolase [Kofleriaceae bacterium]|nr:MBL fold metallo-hydrolase [Kofleriaceae bacterium]
MIFRQLVDARSWTYTYLLADEESKEAILIDPVFEQVRRDSALLQELGLTLKYTVDTHVHADHVTGSWLLRERLGSKIALMKDSGATGVDLELSEGDTLAFGKRHLRILSTPGHTNGCGTFVLDDESMAFTGDSLMIRGCGRTDFQQGDSRVMYQSIHKKLFTLPENCSIYPGHDYKGRLMTSVKEEKEFNPRCGGARSEDDFVGLMENLGLPHPAQLAVALPANLKCGEPSDGKPMPKEPDWAPLRYSFAGLWQVEAQWLMEHQREVQMVDVRPAEEIATTLGTIAGATLLALDNVVTDAEKLDRSKPIVVICRSGGRSSLATLKLMKAGFEKIANLNGGVLCWSADGGDLVSKV